MRSTGEAIETALRRAGISLDLPVQRALSTHLEMVIAANMTMSLTSVVDPDRAAWVHVVDALLGLPLVAAAHDGPMCDLGSGAGYPGIPLCISSRRRTTLVESTGKKASFLRQLIEVLALDAEVLAERAEKVGSDRRGQFAAVTVRALSALPSVLELAAPLLAPGGRVIAYKGRPEEAEIDRGDKVAALLGLRRVGEERLALAGAADAQRMLFVYERTGDARVALPRREGLAQHSPLA